MSNAVLTMIKEEDVEYVDIRFTDPRGKLQHVTVMSDQVDEDFLEEGFMFDGSSIAGWKSIDQSDMKLMPDTTSSYMDPFFAEKTLAIHCNVVEPDTGEAYERDPRGTALKAEAIQLPSERIIGERLERIDPEGEPFNPDYHQAMSMQETADAPANTVINVFQKGYLLNGRLVRPAMVVVAKAPAGQNATYQGQADDAGGKIDEQA